MTDFNILSLRFKSVYKTNRQKSTPEKAGVLLKGEPVLSVLSICKALSSIQHRWREACLHVLEERNAMDGECWETILETVTTPSVGLSPHCPFSLSPQHAQGLWLLLFFFLSINSTSKEQDITQRKKIKICSPTPSSLSPWEFLNQWSGYYICILKPNNTLIHRAEGIARCPFVKTSDSKPLLWEQQLKFLLGAVARSDQPGYQKHRRPLLLYDRMVRTTK